MLIFPMMFLAFVRIAQDYEQKEGWYLMLLVICASYGLNMSSVFLVPLQAGGYLGALFCTKRKAVIWKRAVLCLLPCVVMAGVYLLTKKVWLITIP